MSNKECIGILLPFKNEGKHLQSCLESIARQSYSNFRVAMVDDHSSDHSTDIAKSMVSKDARFQYFENRGQGVVAALKTAAQQLDTKYISRMDGDDIMPPYKLAALKTAVKPNVLVYGSVRYFGKVTEGYRKYEHWLNSILHKKQWKQEMFRECVVPACAWMMLTEDFKRTVHWEQIQLPEDYHLLLQWFTGGLQIRAIPNMVHWWRHHSNRTSLVHTGYQITAFTALKWRVLQEHYLAPNTPLVLWGRGPKLKVLKTCLGETKQPVLEISDMKRAEEKLSKHLLHIPSTVVLSVVGSKSGMEASRSLFLQLGLQENQSFFFL